MSGRPPDELAREVREALHALAPYPDAFGDYGAALAALAELQAQAERAEAVERHNVMAAETNALLREQRDRAEAALAAAVPPPADQQPCAACGYVGEHSDVCPTHLFAEPSA